MVGDVDDPVHVVERGPVVVVMDGGRTHRPDMFNFHSTVALKDSSLSFLYHFLCPLFYSELVTL